MPYLRLYDETLLELGVEYDLIYWDRFGLIEEKPEACSRLVRFSFGQEDNVHLWIKSCNFLRYTRVVAKHLRSVKYQKIIVLTSVPALLLWPTLMRRERDSYVVDIRDYSFEKIWLYRKLLKHLVARSYRTYISSEGFKSFLPSVPKKFFLSLNFKEVDATIRNKFYQRDRRKEDVIRILYIGAISYYDENIKFLSRFGNNMNFLIQYVGFGPAASLIESHCQERSYSNVEFVGRFRPLEKSDYYYNADLIYNMYGNTSYLTRYALSNKLYDAAIYYRPILVNSDTLMSNESLSNGFGYEVRLEEEDCVQDLLDWYKSIEKRDFKNRCDQYVLRCSKINQAFKADLKLFVGL